MSLKEDLKEALSGDIIDHLPGGFEIIGNIAVFSIPPELDDHKKQIARH
ncbi:hypothetical protein [Methanooceanicella nereidis]|nr:hypothetical protein [Methanocella sp. CWC-04]